ncbi:hypothetical protein HYC85_022508 [Camellia sinensis]|uniref:Uncharacterized protein n=1 Tax=Camellia sinensis TaxID=4442 RepID=A0A7J7GN72_CAMSI|nr:hypothetical protein HYC85_022508 [Camellia sinensis]
MAFRDADWNGAFNFSNNLEFVTICIKQKKAEIKFYFNSFFERRSSNAQFLRPNKNCNLTSWVLGCESGWASSVALNVKVDLKNSKDIPERTRATQPCCEGFFCPQGITCMIPCPLGSYCPCAKLNQATGICDPYNYQLPPGKKNHSCGGADTWADVASSSKIFCSAGSYCPTTTNKVSCSSRVKSAKRHVLQYALRFDSCWNFAVSFCFCAASAFCLELVLLVGSGVDGVDCIQLGWFAQRRRIQNYGVSCFRWQLGVVGLLEQLDIIVRWVLQVKNVTCFRLSKCNSNTENQNIHAYGIILIVSGRL